MRDGQRKFLDISLVLLGNGGNDVGFVAVKPNPIIGERFRSNDANVHYLNAGLGAIPFGVKIKQLTPPIGGGTVRYGMGILSGGLNSIRKKSMQNSDLCNSKAWTKDGIFLLTSNNERDFLVWKSASGGFCLPQFKDNERRPFEGVLICFIWREDFSAYTAEMNVGNSFLVEESAFEIFVIMNTQGE